MSDVEKAVSLILERIKSGEFSGGQRLIEADLISDFGINRGPVREALRILAGDGVVELVPNKGARVRRLEERDLIEIYEVLIGLHWVSVRICADRAREKDVRATIEKAYETLHLGWLSRDESTWFIALGQFHTEIFHATGNELLVREYNRLRHVHFHRELTRYIRVRDWDRYIGVYTTLTDAMLNQKTKKAEQTMIDHLDNLLKLLRSDKQPAIYFRP